MDSMNAEALKLVPFLNDEMLTNEERVRYWLTLLKSAIEKDQFTHWSVSARARINVQRIASLVTISANFEDFSKRLLSLVKPESSNFSSHFLSLTQGLAKPNAPLIHGEAIFKFCNEIEKLTLESAQISPIVLPENFGVLTQEAHEKFFEEISARIQSEILEGMRISLSRDISTSLLAPALRSGSWDRSETPGNSNPSDIFIWAETKAHSNNEGLCLDVSGEGTCWKKQFPPEKQSGSPLKRKFEVDSSPQQEGKQYIAATSDYPTTPTPKKQRTAIWCDWCRRNVVDHRSDGCLLNPKNKKKLEDYQNKVGPDEKKEEINKKN